MTDRRPFAYRVIVGMVRWVMRLFFRRIEVEGQDNVPLDRGGLLVAWHPNGLIDPALIVTQFPGHAVFGARDGLLRWPILGWAMRAMGTVPIYRPQDNANQTEEARRAANQKSLDALALAVVNGSYAALFPEGVSHDNPHLSEIRSGAARLALRAHQLATESDGPEQPPVVLPVGLHYDRKSLFRSEVLVTFHPPLEIPDELVIGDPATEKARANELTERIKAALIRIVRPTEDWRLHALMHRARALISAEATARDGIERPETLTEKTLGFAQIWHGYQARRESHTEEIGTLRADITNYDRRLRALDMDDADLDRPPRLGALALGAILLFQAIGVFLLLPPFLVLGYVVNLPVHVTIQALAKRFASAEKDTATIKILAGLVLYPLAWLVAGLIASGVHVRLRDAFPALPDTPFLVGLVVFILAMFSGALVLIYTDLARKTARAIRIRLARQSRADVVAELRTERADLHDRFLELAQGLVFPDDLTDDEQRFTAPAPRS
ncbi:MAG: 1-acyl-sn-glycerol-3-phosphate acyltransferase [Bacteroidota bacterium]